MSYFPKINLKNLLGTVINPATEDKQDDIISAVSSTVLAVTNAIEQIAFDLNAAPFSATTNVTNDYILDSIELNFSTTESKTITVTSSDGTILYKDTNTNQSISLVDINTGFNGGENITVAVTQFGSAGTMDCVLKVRQGTNTLLGDPSLGASAEVIGKVRVVDANGVEVTDPYTYAIKTITTVHAHVHAGRMFTAGYYNASVLNNGTVELLIQVGSDPIHLIPRVSCGGDAVLSMFTGVTFSAAGTAVTASNHLSTSAKVTTTTITHTPTITGAGTQFDGIWFLPGGSGGNAPGGEAFFDTELVLSANTDYLIRLTNISGNSKPAMLNVQFYEPTL